MVTPGTIPVTTPDELTVPTPGDVLDQVPPDGVPVRASVDGRHRIPVPDDVIEGIAGTVPYTSTVNPDAVANTSWLQDGVEE